MRKGFRRRRASRRGLSSLQGDPSCKHMEIMNDHQTNQGRDCVPHRGKGGPAGPELWETVHGGETYIVQRSGYQSGKAVPLGSLMREKVGNSRRKHDCTTHPTKARLTTTTVLASKAPLWDAGGMRGSTNRIPMTPHTKVTTEREVDGVCRQLRFRGEEAFG